MDGRIHEERKVGGPSCARKVALFIRVLLLMTMMHIDFASEAFFGTWDISESR